MYNQLLILLIPVILPVFNRLKKQDIPSSFSSYLQYLMLYLHFVHIKFFLSLHQLILQHLHLNSKLSSAFVAVGIVNTTETRNIGSTTHFINDVMLTFFTTVPPHFSLNQCSFYHILSTWVTITVKKHPFDLYKDVRKGAKVSYYLSILKKLNSLELLL